SAGGGDPDDGPLQGRVAMFVGTNGLCRVLATGAQRAGAIPIIAGRDKHATQTLAHALGCRFVLEEAVYTTLHDVLVRCDDTALHPGYLRRGMTVVDATALPRSSALLVEAGQRGCHVVSPRLLLIELVNRYLRAIAAEVVPREFLLDVLRPLIEDDQPVASGEVAPG